MSEVQVGQEKEVRYLSVRERESIAQQLGAFNEMADASPDGYVNAAVGAGNVTHPAFTVRKKQMSEGAKRLNEVLRQGTPPDLNDSEKAKLDKTLKELGEEIAPALETYRDIHAKFGTADWMPALEKAKIRPQYEAKIQKYMNLRRLRFPNDPDASNLDTAFLALVIGSNTFPEMTSPRICQYPEAPLGLYAYCLPPDSHSATAAAEDCAQPGPPAATQRFSSPAKDRFPPETET